MGGYHVERLARARDLLSASHDTSDCVLACYCIVKRSFLLQRSATATAGSVSGEPPGSQSWPDRT